MPSQKIKHRKSTAGRRPVDKSHRAADGQRIADALRQRGWSQADAARRSKIPPGELNALINNKRDLGREHLRKLGAAGISPEYVLGLTSSLIAPGQERDTRKIGDDLATLVENELNARVPVNIGNSLEQHRWEVQGDDLLINVVAMMIVEAKRELARKQSDDRIQSQVLSIMEPVETLLEAIAETQANTRVRDLAESLERAIRHVASDIYVAHSKPEPGRPVRLISRPFVAGQLPSPEED